MCGLSWGIGNRHAGLEMIFNIDNNHKNLLKKSKVISKSIVDIKVIIIIVIKTILNQLIKICDLKFNSIYTANRSNYVLSIGRHFHIINIFNLKLEKANIDSKNWKNVISISSLADIMLCYYDRIHIIKLSI